MRAHSTTPTSATPRSVPTPPGMRSASTGRCASTTCAAPRHAGRGGWRTEIGWPIFRADGSSRGRPRLRSPAGWRPGGSPSSSARPRSALDRRTDRVLREFGLMLGSLPSAARKALAAALVLLDQGARLYPPSRGRRFARLDDRVAGAYIRALLTRHDVDGRDDPAAQERGHHVLLRAARGAAGDRLRRRLTSRPSPGAAWSPTARRSARPKQDSRASQGGLWRQASRDRSERADRGRTGLPAISPWNAGW